MQPTRLKTDEERAHWAERARIGGERMRAVPEIWFFQKSDFFDREPCLNRTGIRVRTVITTWRGLEWDEAGLAQAYHWLTWDQLQGAIDYYELYRDEVDAEMAENDSWTEERVWSEFPETRPPWR